MKHPLLVSEPRTILGKKVKQLRREGLVPANVYGKGLESKPIQVKLSDFQAIYKEVGETGLVDLKVGETTKPVLIKNLQLSYPLRLPLHVDFYQVNLKEKVKTMVPVVLTGEPTAVTEKVGILLQTLSEVEIEALPAEIPENIEVPADHLAAVDEQIMVSDLKAPSGVTILTAEDQTVAKIGELVVEEPEPETPAEGEETTEGTEGEKTTEEGETKEEAGEDKSEEAKEEKKEE